MAGRTPDKISLKNTAGSPINLATEEKQDEIILLLDDFSINIQIDSGNSNLQYIGLADPESDTFAAVWKIKRVDCTSGTIILYADGNSDFDNIFDDRESLNYS